MESTPMVGASSWFWRGAQAMLHRSIACSSGVSSPPPKNRSCQREFPVTVRRDLVAAGAIRRGTATVSRDNAGLLALPVGVDAGHPGVDLVGQQTHAQ